MLIMRRRDREREQRPQLQKEREQREGVRPARARDDDMRAARQNPLPPHMLIETMREMRQLRHSVPPRRNR